LRSRFTRREASLLAGSMQLSYPWQMWRALLGVLLILISSSIYAQTNPKATQVKPVAAQQTTAQPADRKRNDFYSRATAFIHDVRQLEPLDRHQRTEAEMERDDIREH
jgi:hypothetical protein